MVPSTSSRPVRNSRSSRPTGRLIRGAVSVWENNFSHVEQLYNYGSAVRKIMYTTNAIESVNSASAR